MAKFSIKKLAAISLLGIFLSGTAGIVSAQQMLSKGGDSFENAVKLDVGSYQEGSSFGDEEAEYFYLENIKPGQEVNIKGTFTADEAIAILVLYNEDRIEVIENYGEVYEVPTLITLSWLPNTNKDLYKYYIKAGSDLWDIDSYSLDISLVDRYDAGSQTDAGDSFEKTISLMAGEYEGYLAGEKGADTKDFYKMEIKEGEELTVKLTPPMEASMEMVLYDDSRKELKHEYASNPGAIIETSLMARESEDIFVAVLCDEWCSEDLVNYTLDVSIQPSAEAAEVPVEEEGAPEVTLPPSGEAGEAGEVEKGIFSGVVPWIAGLVILLIIIGIIVSSFLKKKE